MNENSDSHLTDPTGSPEPPAESNGDSVEAPLSRAASMTLRRADAREETASLDPAQQSLNQALRLSFGMLKILMIVLFVLFITSGFRTIQEGNRGLRLRFGAIQDLEAVGSGAVWTWPQPLGELLIIPATPQDLTIDTFIPFRNPNELTTPWTQIRRSPGTGLRPGRDGYLLTSDGNIVHAEWRVRYRIDDPVKREMNLAHGQTERLVRKAAERGIVYAVSRTTIDDPAERTYDVLLGIRETIQDMARRRAQQTLSELDSGIVLDSLTIRETSPPIQTRDVFQRSAAAQSAAQQEREEARQEAVQILSRVAGEAHSRLVHLIDRYGEHIERGEPARADHVLARIESILVGEPLPEDEGVRVAGTASTVIEAAKRERVGIRQSAEGEYRTFRAMREQFENAPLVTITKYWQDAFLGILRDPYTQTMLVPGNADHVEIILGPDPDIMRDLWRRQREHEAAVARETYERERGLLPDPTAARRERDRARERER